MPAKKATPTKAKGKRAPARRKRNPEGVSIMWGGGSTVKSSDGGGGKNGGSPRRKRSPATPAEESEEGRKANELLLQVWESIYAKRDRFGKFD